ncbi:GntP family transporter [Tessaracoccus caeni]|uniref:GntP family transporter n=1 Tax=Tessaracoccus caeni TaxID=3031239 RepID=UPI0023DB4F67|nr:GntP family transporter [Tessaracoccus caeni]MDF1489770.1 GntP family transporter [Tessaracoccus caeni]
MSTLALLLIALAAVAVLLVLVIKVELPAYVSLLLVSMGTAIVTGIAIEEVVPVMIAGMGKVLGSVAIVVGLGSMLGRLIEVSGGADHLARTFTEKLGRARVAAALTIAAFILGIPVFFDVGFIILAPIVFGFAKVAGINPLKLALPVGAILLTVHVTLPPHPGPVAAAAQIGADVGLVTLVGLLISAVVGVIAFFVCKLFAVDKIVLGSSPASDATVATEVPDIGKVPSAATVVGLIVFPIFLIMVGSTLLTVLPEENALRPFAAFVGAPTTALLLGLLVAYIVIGGKARWDKSRRSSVAESALPIVAIIIFVTGAGGVFGNVLVESGIGTALSDSLTAVGMPTVVAAFVISLALRAAQGSATVAMLTTAGLLSTAIANGDYSTMQTVLICLAIGFGALGLSHINDSGFWIVTKYLGLSVGDGLKTWTVLTTICGVTGFLITWGLYQVV